MSELPSPEAMFTRQLSLIDHAKYPYSIDKQQRTIEFIQATLKVGGLGMLSDPALRPILEKMAATIGQTPERLIAITKLPTAQEVRRALKAQPQIPRLRLGHEKVYPRSGWLGTYLEFSLLSEQPLGWHFWAALAVLGAACRRNLYMDLGFGDVVHPNTYVLLVGDSGLGKNQVINRAVKILKRANQSDELVAACLSKGVDRRVEILNETTAESLMMALSPGDVEIPGTATMIQRVESCGALVNPEATNLLGKGRKEVSDRLISYLTDMYDGDPKSAITVTRGARILGPAALTLILGSTAEWIGASITQALVSGGFTGRCTFVQRGERDRVKYRDIPADHVPDPVVESELARMLVPWMLADPVEGVMEPDAQGWWEEWYVAHREAEPPSSLLEGWWQRKPVHLAKVAMLLTASDLCSPDLELEGVRSVPISLKTLQLAKRLLDLEQERIPKLLEHIDRAPEVPLQQHVKEKLRQLLAKQDPVTHTQLFFACRWRVGTPVKMRAVMSALVDGGQVISCPAPTAPGDARAVAYTMDTTARERREADGH